MDYNSARVLCLWDSPGKNTGVGGHALLQGIFPNQGSNLGLLQLLHCWQTLSPKSHLGSSMQTVTVKLILLQTGAMNIPKLKEKKKSLLNR